MHSSKLFRLFSAISIGFQACITVKAVPVPADVSEIRAPDITTPDTLFPEINPPKIILPDIHLPDTSFLDTTVTKKDLPKFKYTKRFNTTIPVINPNLPKPPIFNPPPPSDAKQVQIEFPAGFEIPNAEDFLVETGPGEISIDGVNLSKLQRFLTEVRAILPDNISLPTATFLIIGNGIVGSRPSVPSIRRLKEFLDSLKKLKGG